MNKVLFPAISCWLLLLIPVTFFGFYPTYFSKLTETATVFHLHAFFMVLWIAMAIIQPLLIKRKNTRMHRLIGKISYFIMPFVFITAWFVIRHVYNVQMDKFREEGISAGTPFSVIEIRSKAADYIAIGIVYLVWLIIFYTMAVNNRKRMLFHATYMFAAILTLLGPTADRLIYFTLIDIGWKYNFVAQNFVFFFILFLLIVLMLYKQRKGNTLKPAAVALSIYSAGLLVIFFLPKTGFWNAFVNIIL